MGTKSIPIIIRGHGSGGAGLEGSWSEEERPDNAPKEGLFGRILAEAEARMAEAGGPEEIWGQPRMVAAITEALKRPSSGTLYKQVRYISPLLNDYYFYPPLFLLYDY